MRKKNLFLLSAFVMIISVFILSCKKDSTSTNTTVTYGASVNTVDDFTKLSIFGGLNYFGSQAWTMGVLFKSAKDGRITHIGARLQPGTYTVALWDSTAQSVIKSANVTVTDSTVYAWADIDDVAITAGKVYAITVNNKPASLPLHNYWDLNITNVSDYFPRTLGDITLISEIENQTDDPLSLFGSGYLEPSYIIGFPAFQFEPKL